MTKVHKILYGILYGKFVSLNNYVYSLDSELVFTNRHTVDKLYGAPQPVELVTLINIHDPIRRRGSMPYRVIQVGFDACQHYLKHGQSTAQSLSC